MNLESFVIDLDRPAKRTLTLVARVEVEVTDPPHEMQYEKATRLVPRMLESALRGGTLMGGVCKVLSAEVEID